VRVNTLNDIDHSLNFAYKTLNSSISSEVKRSFGLLYCKIVKFMIKILDWIHDMTWSEVFTSFLQNFLEVEKTDGEMSCWPIEQ
jgi:tetrahydromethanopterin S-methyltransferase subunit G